MLADCAVCELFSTSLGALTRVVIKLSPFPDIKKAVDQRRGLTNILCDRVVARLTRNSGGY